MAKSLDSDDLIFLFDLDNTLYPRSSGLLRHLDQRINAYLRDLLDLSEDAVDELRRRYVSEYGTTLRGCQVELGVDPREYIARTHTIDPRLYISPDKAVERTLRELPGMKVVFSNSPKIHVDRVLSALDLTQMFDKVYTIEFFEYVGKPDRSAYERVLADLNADPERCVMIEDTPVNLVVPYEMGMTTVLISDDLDFKPDYVDYAVKELLELLRVWESECVGRTAV